jgi:hypothetical protein
MIITLNYAVGTASAIPTERCPAGETLTIDLVCVDAAGIALDLTGYTIVLGWQAPHTGIAARYEVTGGSTGLASWTFGAGATLVLEALRAYLDVWLEDDATGTRERIIPRGTVYFDDAIAPPDYALCYYGVGTAGKTNVTGLSEYESANLNLSFTVAPTAQKVYFAHPTSYGTPDLTVEGFAFDALAASTITVGGVSYKLIESTNLLTSASLTVISAEPVT